MAVEKLKPYFELSQIDNNRINGICRLCKRNYKDLYGIYSNFKKHLKRQHPFEYQKAFCFSQEDDLSFDIITLPDDSTTTDLSSTTDKSKRVNLSIAKNLIIKCNLPLSLVENPAFRVFMKECVPKWEPMSSKKLKNAIIMSFKEQVRTTMYETLQNIKHLSLTIDGWSDRRGRGFLGITCHFIDDKMASQAYLVDFVRMKSSHTSENIQRQTEYILDSYNIKEKVFRIITDNASNMVKAYKFGLSGDEETDNCTDAVVMSTSANDSKTQDGTEDFDPNDFQCVNLQQDTSNRNPEVSSSIRISCFAHTLQLAIRDGLHKVFQVSKVLEKCQTLARCAQKSQKIVDLLDHLNKHIERTTLTRWNSEFILVKSILSINREDLESITNLMENPVRFSVNDLTIMEEVTGILEPFYEISLKCQAEKIATVSLVVPSIVHLLTHLQSFNESNTSCYKLAQQLQAAIERRFAGIVNRLRLTDMQDNDPFNDPLYFMATVLDPVFKFYWIYDLKLSAQMETRLKQSIIQLIVDEISKNSTCSSTDALTSVTETNTSSSISSSLTSINCDFKRRKLFVYDEYRYRTMSSNGSGMSEPSRELDVYLSDPVESKFSEYWQRSQLAGLKSLVIRLFSVQASSAPVERVFSHAGVILSSRRTHMNEQLFKDLVFLKVNQSLL